MTISDQTRANRVAAGKKAAATRKRMAALRAFMADGTPMPGGGRPGLHRGDYSPGEILARIKAGGPPESGTGET